MRLIDISQWKIDEEFSPYPEGSRDKYAVIAPVSQLPSGIVPEHRYLMKFSNRRYPVQFWSELMAFAIAKQLHVQVPPTFIAIDPATGQPGSLIEWFYGPQIEHSRQEKGRLAAVAAIIFGVREAPTTHSLYVPGSNYMRRFIPDYDLRTGRQHNFVDLARWITAFSRTYRHDFWPQWCGMLLFDALIGNTDRHQDNWGVLWRADNAGNLSPRFAPAFDNGTSLAHEIMEEKLSAFDSEALDRYVQRGRHHLRWQRDDQKQCGHIELIRMLAERQPALLTHVHQSLDANIDAAFVEIEALTSMEIAVPLSGERVSVIRRMVNRRIELLREAVAT